MMCFGGAYEECYSVFSAFEGSVWLFSLSLAFSRYRIVFSSFFQQYHFRDKFLLIINQIKFVEHKYEIFCFFFFLFFFCFVFFFRVSAFDYINNLLPTLQKNNTFCAVYVLLRNYISEILHIMSL